MFPHFQAVAFYVWQLETCSNNIKFLLCLEKHHPFKNIICHHFIAQWIDLLGGGCSILFDSLVFIHEVFCTWSFYIPKCFCLSWLITFWKSQSGMFLADFYAFRKSFLYVLIVLIFSQGLQRLNCLEVLSLFCHQSDLLNPNECEKWERSLFAWLLQQHVENDQIAGEDDSVGNLNSSASSSVGTSSSSECVNKNK